MLRSNLIHISFKKEGAGLGWYMCALLSRVITGSSDACSVPYRMPNQCWTNTLGLHAFPLNHYIHISTSASSLTCSSSTTKKKHNLKLLSSVTKPLLTHTLASFWRKQSCLLCYADNRKQCMWDSRFSIRVYQDHDAGQLCWNQCFAGIKPASRAMLCRVLIRYWPILPISSRITSMTTGHSCVAT